MFGRIIQPSGPRAPVPELDAKRLTVSERLRSGLDAGENILIYCRGGVEHGGGPIAA